MEGTTEARRVSTKAKKLVDMDTDDTLTPVEAKKVRHGLKQLKERKTRPWSQVKQGLGL